MLLGGCFLISHKSSQLTKNMFIAKKEPIRKFFGVVAYFTGAKILVVASSLNFRNA